MWMLSSSSDRGALDVVDGAGIHAGRGPHYSRRTPGSRTFTGVGKEIVLITDDGMAVWACVLQKTPAKRGSGSSRGRDKVSDTSVGWVWRNMMFRNLGKELSSDLIRSATRKTYEEWVARYVELPEVRLRTEVDIKKVSSKNPGYCYQCAGWEKGPIKRGKLFLYSPRDQQEGPVF